MELPVVIESDRVYAIILAPYQAYRIRWNSKKEKYWFQKLTTPQYHKLRENMEAGAYKLK